MTAHTFTTPRTARYYVLGTPSAETRHVWFVFHGIGQQAGYFIRHFEGIVDAETVVVAPEGLSRYYLDGKYERVGASWMTREMRMEEIQDQITFLDGLASTLFSEAFPQASPPALHLLGFSQGVATAWRWLMQGTPQPDSLILWAGRSPEEYSEKGVKRLLEIPLWAGAGTKDPYVSEPLARQEWAKLSSRFSHLQTFRFEGKHTMDIEALDHLKSSLYTTS